MNSSPTLQNSEHLANYLLQRLNQVEPKLKQITGALLRRMAVIERGRVPLLEVAYLVKMAVELQQLLKAWRECCLVVERLQQAQESVPAGFAIAPVERSEQVEGRIAA